MISTLFIGLSAVCAIIAIVISIITKRQTSKLSDRQHQSLVFMEYTKRYQEIMLLMPLDFEVDKESSQRFMQLYFNLCSEEYWLYHKKLLPEDLWNIWVKRMQIDTNVKAFHTYWKMLSYPYDNEFVKFFSHEVIDKIPTE